MIAVGTASSSPTTSKTHTTTISCNSMLFCWYTPFPYGIDSTWQHEIQLLCYLYYNPGERVCLRRQINAAGHYEGQLFHITHSSLTYPLGLRVGQTDFSFQLHIKFHLEDLKVIVPDPIYLPECMSISTKLKTLLNNSMDILDK